MIFFDIEDNVIRNIEFYRGCSGNWKAIAKLFLRPMRKGHPDKNELTKAAAFAKMMVK